MPAPRRLTTLMAALLALVLVAPAAVAAASPGGGSAGLHPTGLVRTPTSARGLSSYAEQLTSRTTASGALAAAPEAYDLSQWAPPVGNQGQVGSCTSWATGYYERYWLRNHALGETTLFAPMFLYAQISQGVDRGSSFSANFSILVNQGISPMSTYTWGNYDYTNQPTATDKANATAYKASSYANLFYGPTTSAQAAIMAAISAGRPVMIAIPVYPGFDRANSTNPDIDVPVAGETSRGNHAVWAPKYDATGLWIENSWGTGWGAAGWGHLTWAFVNQYAWEGWTLSSSTTDVAPGTTVITSFTPASGPVGTSVTLNGFNFTGATSVTFNGTAAAYTVVSDTQINATVPAGATSGPITVVGSSSTGSSASNFTVTLPATTLAYTGSTSAGPGAPVTLSAKLSSGGAGLAGRTVRFTLNGSAWDAVTDGAGTASVSTTAPATAATYTVGVSFASDGTYAGSSTSGSLKVAVIATAVKYTGPTSMSRGSTVTISATLKTSAGVAIAGKILTFAFVGKTYTAVTDASGVARVTITAPATKGNSKLTVTFAAGGGYGASSSSTTVRVV